MKERVQLNLRFDGRKDLLEAIKEAADDSGLSVNAWAIQAFEAALGLSSASPPKRKTAAVLMPKLESRMEELEQRLARLEESSQSGEIAA